MQAGLAGRLTKMTPTQTPSYGFRTLLLLACWSCLAIQTVNGQCNCATDCVSTCGAGQYFDSGTCVTCPQGKYCAGGSSSAVDCVAGTYNVNTGSSSISDCLNCAAGKTSTAGSSTCTDCPAGTKCASPGTATPTTCASGTYSSAGSSDCTACPIGSFCVSNTGTPQPCPAGYYTSSTGQSSCTTKCPGGSECPGNGVPQQCPDGTYSNEGDGVCTSCPAGQYSGSNGATSCTPCDEGYMCPTTGTKIPTQCAAGYVAAQGSSSCTLCANNEIPDTNNALCEQCPAGYECTNPANSPTQCANGYYALLGDAVCTQCPAGSACPSKTLAPTPCTGTQYSAAGSTVCTECPAGSTCDGATSTSCTAGQYSAAGSTSCTNCSAGTYCPLGASAESPCQTGYYSEAGAAACSQCPAGFYCPDTATKTACPAGQYSEAEALTCINCPAGSQCLSADQLPTVCPTGYYNGESSTTACLICPGGYYCADGTQALPCGTGYISANGSTSCTACPAGWACPDNTDPAQNYECADGSYSGILETTCTVCPAGSRCPTNIDITPIPCLSGTYSLGNQTACTVCEAGSMCPNTDGTGIQPCAAGTYSGPGETSCTDCVAGFACPSTNTSNDIVTCPDGTYAEARATVCTPCPAGFFCPTTRAAVETACALGYYSVGNQSTCTRCPVGQECPDAASNSTTLCQQGYYSLGTQIACTLCAEGDYCATTTDSGLPCGIGEYSEAGKTNCTTCEAGYYCPNSKASYKQQCPAGYYSTAGSTNCQACNAGYRCQMGSDTPSPLTDICDQGGWCDGELFYACGAGTYNPLNGSTSILDCVQCPAGYYCEGPGLTDYSNYTCPTGHYCLEGTTSRTSFPCPGGTYNPNTGLTHRENCTVCPIGSYCIGGLDAPADCPPGFYCALSGQTSGQQTACPAGFYSNAVGLNSSSQCIECPVGHYCPGGTDTNPTTDPTPCPAGTYNPSINATDQVNCHQCEKGFACNTTGMSDSTVLKCKTGYYCPFGTIEFDQFPCLPGSYGLTDNLTSADECSTCPLGYICGWATTDFGDHTPPQNCAQGHYCPEMTASPDQYPCPPGTFTYASNLSDSTQCDQCTAGFYCIGGEKEPTGVCPRGYYCPEGTAASTQYGCPNGTYNDLVGLSSVVQCKNCTQGHYCEFAVSSTSECFAGTYMPYGVDPLGDLNGTVIGGTTAQRQFECLDCPGGSYCGNATIDPAPCGVGFYSADRQYQCKACEYGHYCDNATTSETDMLNNKKCPPGRYCVGSLTAEANAVDCDPGHYCPEATVEMLNCPVGTIRTTPGGGAVTDCEPCPAGYYCLEESSVTTGSCLPGYYCPTNFTNPFNNNPPFIGSYGNDMYKCPEGTYSNVTATPDLASCLQCPAGYYCALATANPVICDRGYYCDAGSHKPEPCPIGTYGNRTGLTGVAECTYCDPGSYCDAPGLTLPRDLCTAGYLCYSGATTSTPTNNATQGGERCVRGGYCPVGSYEALPCPPGTYNNVTGAISTEECTTCDPGYYCNTVAGGEPSGLCYAGFYCEQGASTPMQFSATPGHFTLEGARAQEECPIATYAPYHNTSACLTCPPGFYCPDKAMNYTVICPVGAYCPEGSYQYYTCPPGTFLNETGKSNLTDCINCPAGYYCQDTGLFAVTGPCKEGHICYLNALSNDPVFNNDTTGNLTIITYGDRCHPGYYCPQGTTYMIPCPEGTYREHYGGRSESECTICDPGKYCNGTANIAVTGDCDQGYFCNNGSHIPNPVDGIIGDICPAYKYCPTGSSVPQSCLIGYMANRTGMADCELCIAGYICYPDQAPTICPQGKYCVASTVLIPVTAGTNCPVGTYGASAGLEAEANCTACDGGHYCETTGLLNVTGPISAGFWAITLAETSTPVVDDNPNFGVCPRGYYCPQQSVYPTPCPAGTYGISQQVTALGGCLDCDPGYYCPSQNMTTTGTQCTAGYYCSGKSSEAAPVNQTYGSICPTGHYCPLGSSMPLGCAAGTYADVEGKSACDPCPQGKYCPLNTTTPESCPMGYICKASQASATTYPCAVGKFNNLTERYLDADCIDCPPGYYCDSQGLAYPTGQCDPGWFCLGGSTAAQPANPVEGGQCMAGTYCPAGSVAAIQCDPGQYCSTNGMSTTNGSCDAGYYCSNASITATPVGQSYGDVCPAGQYCPAGSANGTFCPPGTYLPTTGAQADTECLQCTQGSYCAGYGNTAPTATCDPGYYCPTGMNMSNPSDYTCGQGHYCVGGSHQQVRCVSGEYQDQTAQSSCKTCPQGYFCDNTMAPVVLFNNSICPQGYYCPNGTQYSSQYKCPRGTYGNNTGLIQISDCTPCPGGYYCDQEAQTTFTLLCGAGFYCRQGAETATPQEDDDANICPVGHYCPIQTSEPMKCPTGTYSNNVQLTAESECTACPAGSYCGELNMTTTSGLCYAGYYCPENSSLPTQLDCPAGSFCGNGTGTPSLCPKGTYSNQTNLMYSSQCDQCPGGWYCLTEGLVSPTGECREGYYCPTGSINEQPNSTFCEAGHYCPTGSAMPLPCPNRTEVNHTHAPICNSCPAGYYCDDGLGVKTICPAGYYCPNGTGLDWQACPRGTYSNTPGLQDVTQCTPCPPGQYCELEHQTAPAGNCLANYYCTTGVDSSTPDGTNNTGTGGLCPTGHFCPAGTAIPIPCSNGTYANAQGQSVCTTCPAGYYCPDSTSDYTVYPCEMGHYCLDGTKYQYEYPCPTGTFNNQTHATSLANCYSCTAGMYCQTTGLSTPTGLCYASYYCDGGSATPTPTGAGGGFCTAGFFCPEGSTQMTPCTPGSYCATDYLNTTTGLCQQGYYCTSAATMPNPTDGTTGNICPTGHYCPEGSVSGTPCPASTYLNSTGSFNISECLTCIAGQYCDGTGNTLPDGDCSPGYYCPAGQSTATPAGFECPQGHYCPGGSITATRCPSGSYQDLTGQSYCKGCPAGYFCDSTLSPVVLYNSSACPTGHYCPDNTTMATEYPCPSGTFSNTTMLTTSADCQTCSGGMYCTMTGLSEPEGPCDAGYYCTSGSISKAPTSGNAGICTTGHYCPQGTTTPQQCPPGTYNPSTGIQSQGDCTNCTGGYFCPNYAMTTVTNIYKCDAGYYCPPGSDSATYIVCPAGSYCLSGSQEPTECPVGTFSNVTGLTAQSQCTQCPAGFYCPTAGLTEATLTCWGGYYCPTGQSTPNPAIYICPTGMQCPNGSSDYQMCATGFYSSTQGQASCDICPSGKYCLPVVPANVTLNAQDCPQGYYCPEGTGISWQPCPAGTYSSVTGLANITQCTDCTAGQFCNQTALTVPAGDCDPGYYCTIGVDTPTPDGSTNTGVGGVCTVAHSCPSGSSAPVPCAAGTYNNLTGQASCTQCPAGYYCVAQTDDFSAYPCPVGNYCPAGTQFNNQYRCLAGTYNPYTGSTQISDCLNCPGGMYCEGKGNSAPTGSCYAGWYCSGGSSSPNTTTHGGRCQSGYYCPVNSSDPIQCDAGMYCNTEGLSAPVGNCSAGYYCTLGASSPVPTDGTTGNICPAGHYCVMGSILPTPCSPGTYSASAGNTNAGDCHNCTAGDYCQDYNLTATNGDCNAGFYCPEGETLPNGLICPVGHFCVGGTDSPVICPNGQYQDQTGQSVCKTCPGGYYCDNTNGVVVINSTVICPTGHYCPPGTPRQDTYPCDIGTFNNMTGLNMSDECTPCIGGHYCDVQGLSQPAGLCNAGYFCKVNATSQTPTQGAEADICTQGYYCEAGTIDPVACPTGTYGAATGLISESACTPCTAGSYCTTPGLTAVQGPCLEGYFCVQGSNSSTQEICPVGHYCPQGSPAATRCPVGTFNPYTGLNTSADCTACTPGEYCETEGLNMTTGSCDPGFYCPGGQNMSAPADYPCPLGHYCPSNSSQPTPCANGTYMNHTQASACYDCPAGWYCYNGNQVVVCPMGYYCPLGTDFNWQQCPPGTYNNDTGLQQLSDCKSCIGGRYCSAYAGTEPTDDCDAGHYCEFGVDRAQPVECNNTDINGLCLTPGAHTGKGGVCPQGYYCPKGTAQPLPCPAGHYNNMTGMENCTACPAGYFCVQGTQDYKDNPCPAGHYCPAGTVVDTQYPCPAGTYYNLTMATALSDCVDCPPGEYCATPGLGNPTGICNPGYYCTNASTTATPNNTVEGGPCDPGYYCPAGASIPLQCPPGQYCETPLLAAPTGNCSAGYYCTLQASVTSPMDNVTGNVCPMGFYCPAGSSAAVACDAGYFLNVTGSDDVSDCMLCTGGMFCQGTGNALPTGNCDPGYYCPPGQNVSAPSDYNCPIGHYCPGATDSPLRCIDGEYQTLTTQTTCDICLAGYYCDNTVNIAVVNSSTLCEAIIIYLYLCHVFSLVQLSYWSLLSRSDGQSTTVYRRRVSDLDNTDYL